MYRELILITVGALISLLVVAKSDKQSVHILEGKLFKQKRDTSAAAVAYKKHKKLSSVMLFVLGFIGIAMSVIMFVTKSELFILVVAYSLTSLVLGIWGRINTFRAADKELEEQDSV